MREALMRHMSLAMSRMMGFISMRAILDKIMSDYRRCELRNLRPALKAILGSYNYENSILSTALHIVGYGAGKGGTAQDCIGRSA